MKSYPVIVFLIVLISACQNDKRLPIYGERELRLTQVNGEQTADSIYYTIPEFSFTNQDGQKVTSQTFEGKIYITDFFFTTCPTICPVMKKQMKRVYKEYFNNEKVLFLSHAISKGDSVPILKDYAQRMDIASGKWHLVTGPLDNIYEMAKNYFVQAGIDDDAPGGYMHNGYFVLIDPQKRIRGMYDGTDSKAVDKLIKDIRLLLAEYENP